MSLRFARSSGPALLALAVVISLALGAVNLGAGRADATRVDGAPALTLVSQSPWVSPGRSFNLVLGFRSQSGLAVVVTLYRRLTNRSEFAQTLVGQPTGAVRDRTDPIPTGPIPGRAEIALGVTTGQVASLGVPAAPTLNLNCVAECAGVYPVVVTLERVGSGSPVGRFTTYLNYVVTASPQPLRAVVILPFHSPVVIRVGSADPATARVPPSARTVAALSDLAGEIARYPSVPLTIEAVPETAQTMVARGALGRRAVGEMADASAGSTDQFPAQTYVPIDVSALSGLGTDLDAQIRTGQAVLSPLGIHTQRGTWIVHGAVGSALSSGLSQVGADQVVVPDSELATVSTRAGTFSQPFELQLSHGQQVRAAASDAGLSAHFTAQPHDPALAANQLLADLTFIHFEYPNLSTPRGVVAMPPAGWVPNATFVATLLAGLNGNPDVLPVTVNTFFSTVPLTPKNGTSINRHPTASGSSPSATNQLAKAVADARARLTAFASAVPSGPPVLTQLDELLLASESSDLRASGQGAGVATAQRCLDAQLSLVQLATDRTITLTSRSASVPVTILSAASYPLVGDLSLVSDKLFPEGSTHLVFQVSRSTNSVRVEVSAKTTGDLPLAVTLVTPRGNLVITHGQLTVRSTATSLAGIVLTLVAAVVLLTWWARTWRRGRVAKAARARRRP